MKIFNSTLLSVCVLLSLFGANAAASSHAQHRRIASEDKVSVRARGRRLVVNERGRSHTLDVWEQIEAARIEDADAIFLTRKDGFVYLLLSVCGPSKAKPDDHECGAGTECNLVWLKLDENWRKLDAKSVRYDSCWSPIISDGGPTVSGRRASVEYDNLRDNTHHEVTYDADKPEEGLVDKTQPLPKDNP